MQVGTFRVILLLIGIPFLLLLHLQKTAHGEVRGDILGFDTTPRLMDTLAAPTPLWPANGVRIGNVSAIFTWSDVVGATFYQLQISFDSTFVAPMNLYISDGSPAEITFGLKFPPTYRYWRVRAMNDTVNSAWSVVFRFLQDMPIPPAPRWPSPADGADDLPRAVRLSWESWFGASYYEVHLSHVRGFVTIDSIWRIPAVGTSSISTGPLVPLTTYYWRVRTATDYTIGEFSESWSFTVGDGIPTAPLLNTPANHRTMIARDTTLNWFSVPDADQYEVMVARDSLFAAPLVSRQGIAQASYDITSLPCLTKLYWRVRADNQVGTGPWSLTWTFTTKGITIASPALSLPMDSAALVDTAVTLSWGRVDGAEKYQVLIGPAEALDVIFRDTLVLADSANTMQWRVRGLGTNRAYWWMVCAKSACAANQYSGSRNFIVQSTTAAERIASPAGCTLDQNSPNPFSDATSISFFIPAAARVALRVFDALGRDVAELTDAELPAGAHAVQWRTAGLPPGVYVVRLQAGTFSATRSMLLAR